MGANKYSRDDGRGHWPAGRPRNVPGVNRRELAGLLTRLRRLVEERSPDVSYAGAAREAGVDPRTVRRWVQGLRTPPAEGVMAVRRYLARWE